MNTYLHDVEHHLTRRERRHLPSANNGQPLPVKGAKASIVGVHRELLRQTYRRTEREQARAKERKRASRRRWLKWV